MTTDYRWSWINNLQRVQVEAASAVRHLQDDPDLQNTVKIIEWLDDITWQIRGEISKALNLPRKMISHKEIIDRLNTLINNYAYGDSSTFARLVSAKCLMELAAKSQNHEITNP